MVFVFRISEGRLFHNLRLPVFLINARSLLPRIDKLSLLSHVQPLEFIVVTKIWSNDEIANDFIVIM